MSMVFVIQADACTLPIRARSVDLILCAPPYWPQPEDSGDPRAIGGEGTIAEYAMHICLLFDECRRVLRPEGMVVLCLGDGRRSYRRGVPWIVLFALGQAGWHFIREIVWDDRSDWPSYLFFLSPAQRPSFLVGGSVWSVAPEYRDGYPFGVLPERICRLVIEGCSRPGQVVLDPVGGLGSVARVASSLGRVGISVELVLRYLAGG